MYLFDRRRLQSAGNCRELSPRCDDALAHAGPAGGKRASGAAHQSTVASGVPDLFDRGGKGDGSRGLQLLSRTEKKMCSGLTEKELKALDAGICRMLENLTET